MTNATEHNARCPIPQPVGYFCECFSEVCLGVFFQRRIYSC